MKNNERALLFDKIISMTPFRVRSFSTGPGKSFGCVAMTSFQLILTDGRTRAVEVLAVCCCCCWVAVVIVAAATVYRASPTVLLL